ncbi:phosphatase PAP2 family protein [Streptomyces sp. XM4193]|uniref:phosphatase PAP2 family protein n=1 Tax=Streptomyces sp. XM4193 TaxID=2929782 RepID=UPI001FF71C3F|nr:phosphatase PAP2 family protein [Streptomyces sp. XM4193]MCK1798232.1 phosphatase PAP2 family protein [Streptomyces sp. XM4193]
MAGWEDPDVDLLYRVNGWSEQTPEWVSSVLGFMSEYGVIFGLMALGLWTWWTARQRPGSVTAVAGLLWAPLGAVAAYAANYPIRELVERPRPLVDHPDLNVLVEGKGGWSFVSDHSALTMALAVGIFMVNRRWGAVAILLALFQGFGRIYAGVHYPTDVVGGVALGTAVVLLLAPLAMMLLTPLTRAVAASPRGGWLITCPRAEAARARNAERNGEDRGQGGGRPHGDESSPAGSADRPAGGGRSGRGRRGVRARGRGGEGTAGGSAPEKHRDAVV